jgi:hypothetical protein
MALQDKGKPLKKGVMDEPVGAGVSGLTHLSCQSPIGR